MNEMLFLRKNCKLLNIFNILQVVTPQRMELLRVKLREEVEGPYKEVQNK